MWSHGWGVRWLYLHIKPAIKDGLKKKSGGENLQKDLFKMEEHVMACN